MVTVAVVSADVASRLDLVGRLHETGLAVQVRESSDSPEAYAALAAGSCDVLLLDLSPQDPSPQFEAAAHVHRASPSTWIVACSPSHPDSSLLLRAMRFGVREFLERPIGLEALRELLLRVALERGPTQANALPERAIAVLGVRGGVGTSTLAVNVGVQLAQTSRKKTLLLDFARPLGHAALMLDIRPKFSIRDAAQSADRLDEHMLGSMLTRHKSGLDVLVGAMDPREWSGISPEAACRVVDVARGSFDFVVLDLGMCSPHDWESVLGAARMILLVAEADVPSLWAAERQLHALEAMRVESSRIRLVINRWHRRDDSVLKSFEQRIKRNIFLRLPNNFTKVSEAINAGLPISENHDNAIVSKLRQFSAELAGAPAGARTSGLGGFFSSNNTR